MMRFVNKTNNVNSSEQLLKKGMNYYYNSSDIRNTKKAIYWLYQAAVYGHGDSSSIQARETLISMLRRETIDESWLDGSVDIWVRKMLGISLPSDFTRPKWMKVASEEEITDFLLNDDLD